MNALRQVQLATLCMIGLLFGTLRSEEAEPHPLAALSRRLPQHGSLTQLADFDGQPLALFGDPEGRGLRLGGAGKGMGAICCPVTARPRKRELTSPSAV